MRNISFCLTAMFEDAEDFEYDGGLDVELPSDVKIKPGMVAGAMKAMAWAVLTGDKESAQIILDNLNTDNFITKPAKPEHLTSFS